MGETEQEVNAHNAAVTLREIDERLSEVAGAMEIVRGLLDDLAIYLPQKASAA